MISWSFYTLVYYIFTVFLYNSYIYTNRLVLDLHPLRLDRGPARRKDSGENHNCVRKAKRKLTLGLAWSPILSSLRSWSISNSYSSRELFRFGSSGCSNSVGLPFPIICCGNVKRINFDQDSGKYVVLRDKPLSHVIPNATSLHSWMGLCRYCPRLTN